MIPIKITASSHVIKFITTINFGIHLSVMREIDPDPGLGTAQVQKQTEEQINVALEQYI